MPDTPLVAAEAATDGSPKGSRPTSPLDMPGHRRTMRSTSTLEQSTPRSRMRDACHRRRTPPAAKARTPGARAGWGATSAASRGVTPLGSRVAIACQISPALPPLLAATGTFAGLRERLGRVEDDPRRTGRHVRGLVSVPHGAKTYLGDPCQGAVGERLVWIARDAEIADRVAEELGAWLGDQEAVVVLEPRTALGVRTQRTDRRPDRRQGRGAGCMAERACTDLVAGVQSLLQHTIDPADLPRAPRELRVGSRLHHERAAARAVRGRVRASQ